MADDIGTTGETGGVSAKPDETPPALTHTATQLDRADWWSFLVTVGLALAGYGSTLSTNVTLEWSGMLSTSAMYGGVGTPPGHPVWTIYSWLFIKLIPVSNVAWRVSLGSACAAAAASGLVAIMVSRGVLLVCEIMSGFTHRRQRAAVVMRCAAGVTAGLVLGFSREVWREAVIADIWALSLLLFTGVLFSLTLWMFARERRRFLYAAFLLLGLQLTSSQEIIVVLPGLVCAIMLAAPKLGRDVALLVLPIAGFASGLFQWGIWITFPDRLNWPLLTAFCIVWLAGLVLVCKTRGAGSEWKPALVCGVSLFLGLAFYLFVPIASMTTPPVNWGYPRTVEGFLHVLSRGQFERSNPTSELCRFAGQFWLYLAATGESFGWTQLALAALPVCFWRRINPRGRLWLGGLFAIWICIGPLMVAELNLPPDWQADELSGVYFMASHVLLAVWLGFGLCLVAARASKPWTSERGIHGASMSNR